MDKHRSRVEGCSKAEIHGGTSPRSKRKVVVDRDGRDQQRNTGERVKYLGPRVMFGWKRGGGTMTTE